MEAEHTPSPKVCVDSVKILYSDSIASWLPIVPLAGNPANPQCGICHALLKEENAATLFDESTRKLVCLRDAANLHAASVHVFHNWCLQYLIAEREPDASLVCPSCPIGGGNPTASHCDQAKPQQQILKVQPKQQAKKTNNNNHNSNKASTTTATQSKSAAGSTATRSEPKRRLGIDIGGVILNCKFFSENWKEETAPEPNVIEVIARLIADKHFNSEDVFIVSKCGEKFQAKTLEYLHFIRFFELTGMKRENVNFCLKKKDKAGICQRLEINYFVDDSLAVLREMKDLQMTRFYYYTSDEPLANYLCFSPYLEVVSSWNEIRNYFEKEKTL